MYPMRIGDEGNVWRITDEEMQQIRLQSQGSNDGPDSSPSSPSSVCSSNASLDLATFIPSPETFFADDFGVDSANSQHANDIETADIACQTSPAERSEPLSLDVAESLGILMNESVSRDQTTTFQQQPLVHSCVQTTGLTPPPGFPPMPEFEFVLPAMPYGFTPDMASRPSAMDFVAFPVYYCFFHFRNVEFYIGGPTQNSVNSDFNIHVVFRLSVDFEENIAFTMPGDLLRPQGLTTDQTGNLLVFDKNHCVRVFTPEGKLMAVINGNGNLHHPQDLCILPNGKLLILDGYGAFRIY